MRYKNSGPVTVYAVIDTEYGDVVRVFTNKRTALLYCKKCNQISDLGYVVLTYDQRGTR